MTENMSAAGHSPPQFGAPRVFLDLDGTLVDPAEGIIGSIRHALAEVGADVPAPDALGWCIGPPLHESLAKLAGDEAKGATALEIYRARYQAGAMYLATVYPGIPEALAEMRGRGWRLFLATSKPIVYACEITARFGLSTYLEAEYGSELDGTRAAKTDLLAHALAGTGQGPAVMIGDRRHDVIGAKANGLAVVGAAWGYGGAEELSAAGADTVIADPTAMITAVEALLDT